IGRVLKLSPQQMHYSEGRPYFSLDREDGCVNLSVKSPGNGAVVDSTIAENISLVSARQLLDLPMHTVGQLAKSEEIRVVIVGEPGNRYGLWVDNFLEERDLVVRPLDPRLGKVPNVSSAALTEKGEPILILDVADVLRSAETLAASAVGQSMPASKGRSKHLSEADLTEDSTDSSISSIAAQKRVLVVDDSMTVRAMEKKLLQNRGYAVDIAVNGAEGWNAVRMNPYDLVVTDIDMPRMNGIELIEHMRAYGPTQKLPVIIVSYKDRAEDQMAGLNAGANYYLTKSSFHDDGLITAVTDLIGHAAGHSEVGGA
ncbi:MAG: response regulator, partial [Cyanobacteria bacterium J06631_9]